MLTSIFNLFGLIKGSTFFWKLVSNFFVLKNSFEAISVTIQGMHKKEESLPDAIEVQIILKAFSNILKTGVIDMPGVDEYEIAAFVDKMSGQLQISLEDSKTSAKASFMIDTKKKEVKYV